MSSGEPVPLHKSLPASKVKIIVLPDTLESPLAAPKDLQEASL